MCLGGRWLSVAVNRWLFDAIVLAQPCLSHSATAIKHSLTAETGAEVENTKKSTHSPSYTWHVKFVKSRSVNYDGADHSHPA